MPLYIEDENGNHVLDEYGNIIEYTVSNGSEIVNYVHREKINVDSEGH